MAYFIALALTLLIEGAVVFLFGFRTIRDQLQVALVNGMTHPVFHALILLIGTADWKGVPDMAITLLIFEAIITVAEWFLLSRLYPEKEKLFLLLTSLCVNAASAAATSLIF